MLLLALPDCGLPKVKTESPVQHRLLIRILEPQDESTRYVDSFDLAASFTMPETLTEEQGQGSHELEGVPEFEVLLEEFSGIQSRLRAGLILSAERLRLGESENGKKAFLESFEISPNETIVRDPDKQLRGRLGQINARINISALRPHADEAPRLFSLKVLAKDSAQTAVSNEVRFTLQPRLAKIGTLGGFLSHPDATLFSRVLFLEGWALRPGDEILSVEMFANDHSLGYANCKLPSPTQSASLPDFPEAQLSRFAFCLDYDKRKQTAVPEDDWKQLVHLSALIEFTSGHKERIGGVATRWSYPGEVSKELLIGGLESVGYGANGMLHIRGHLVHQSTEVPAIVLRWRGAELLVEESAGTLIWEQAEDVIRRYPSLAHACPGFCIQVAPEAFGRLPGNIEVLLRDKLNGKEVVLGPKGILASIPELLESVRQDSSPGTRLAQSIIQKSSQLTSGRHVHAAGNSGSEKSAFTERSPVLFATHNLSACEGAPRVLLQVIQDMHEQGRPCLVVSPEEGELGAMFKDLGIPVFIIPELATLGQDWIRYHQGLERLQGLLEEHTPGMVYANVLDSFWGIDIAIQNRISTVWAIHESVYPETCFQDMPFPLRTRFLNLLPQVDRAVFVTNATAALFSELIPRERRLVIPNAVHVGDLDRKRAAIKKDDTRRELGISENEVVVTIVGTTTRRKGQDIFIREMATLRQLCPDVALRFLVVGARDIPFLHELRELSRSHDLDDVLHFVYETPDVARYFVASDIIVIASREESAPLVSLEAFAFERPLISTTAFGLAEQIDHEKNALSFKGTEAGALAHAVKRVIEDSPLRARLIAGGRETLISRFSFQKTREQYRSLLQPEVQST